MSWSGCNMCGRDCGGTCYTPSRSASQENSVARFSRAKIVAWVWDYMGACERSFEKRTGKRIDPGNGTAQLDGLDPQACAIYGEWAAANKIHKALVIGDL